MTANEDAIDADGASPTDKGLGLAGVGAYVPRDRLPAAAIEDAWQSSGPSGIERTAVPAGDEDVLTMAYEAAVLALEAASCAADSIEALSLATTTPPHDEESGAARLAGFLGIDGETAQFGASTAAGTNALRSGLEKRSGPVLVVASDAPQGEPNGDVGINTGAGAAAIVLEPGGTGTVTETASSVVSYPGTRFRPRGEGRTRGLDNTAYDRSAYLETIGAVVDRLSTELETLDAAAIQAPDGSLPYRLARHHDLSAEQIRAGTVVHDVGDAGAASSLLGLAAALTAGHESVLLIGYGSGSEASGAVLECGAVPVRARLDGIETITYSDALRQRGVLTPGEPHGGGAYVSLPTWRRSMPQRHRLVVGRCRSCGALDLRPDGACRSCHELTEYDRVGLPGTGTVAASTVIQSGGAPPEFTEQQARSGSFVSAIVALDGLDRTPGKPDESDTDPDETERGADSLSVPMQVLAADEASIEVGDRVETTIRRIYTQEAVPRYGRKAILERDRR